MQDLYIYPLKSAAGIRVESAALDAYGFVGDRRWMLTDAEGQFLTQRQLPRMALLRATLDGPSLRLDAPSMSTLVVPEPRVAEDLLNGGRGDDRPRTRVTIWDDVCAAVEADAASARPWLREFLGIDARLVFAPPGMPRLVDRDYATGDEHVAFPDAFPLLLIGQASLDLLNAKLTAAGTSPALPMNRFRPNIVTAGADAHAEDDWRRIVTGPPDAAVSLDIVKPCARCAIPTIEQSTATQGKEPLTMLATYRRRDGKVYFGQNVIHRSTGIIRAGDPVRVVEG